MDADLREALLGLESRLRQRLDDNHALVMARFDAERVATMARFDSERVTTMARFDRMENKLGNIEAQVTVNIAQMTGMLVDIDSRREQLELLQGAIRAGMTAESQVVSNMRQVVAGMQGLLNRLQSEIHVINERLDEQGRGATRRPS